MERITLACSITTAIFGTLALAGFEDAKIGFVAFFIPAVACAAALLLRRPSTTKGELEESLHKR